METPNKNKMDVEMYNNFLADREKYIEDARKAQRRNTINENLRTWELLLPERYRGAELTKFSRDTFQALAPYFINNSGNVLINTDNSEVGKYFAFACARELIRRGHIPPKAVRTTSLYDAYTNINGMFGSRKWKDYFFDPKAKTFIVYGLSSGTANLQGRGKDAERFWAELFEFVKSEPDRTFIIVWEGPGNIGDLFSDPDVIFHILENGYAPDVRKEHLIKNKETKNG